MRKKRFLAVILAASMVLGNSVTAFATVSYNDDKVSPVKGTATGQASFEGYVNEDIFVVEVPTVAAPTDKTFDFIMDPQRLIEQTSGNKYATSNTNDANRNGISTDSISYGSLYFANRDNAGTVSQLSTSSNYLTVRNKGSRDVTIGLKATVKNMGAVELSSNANVSDNENPSIYLAMQGADLSGNVAATQAIESVSQGASLSTRVSGCDSNYIISVNSKNEYEYVVSDPDSVSYAGYGFRLTGACGGGDFTDWTAVGKAMKTAIPKVTVTWDITPYVTPVAPTIATSSVAKPTDGSGVFVSIDLGAGTLAATGIASITFGASLGAATSPLASTNYEYANGQLKIKGAHVANIAATRVYKIVMNDAAKTELSFTIRV